MAGFTAHQFAAKWRASTHKEISAYVSHFEDLCRLIGHPTPTDIDPTGSFFCYQKANLKESGQRGFADVWYDQHFGWEYAGKGENLEEKYKQLLQYRDNLANPPLLVVCDFDNIEVHTNFNGTVSQSYPVTLDHIADSSLSVEGTSLTGIQVIRACFYSPEDLRPGQTTEGLTKDAADRFGKIAESLRINWQNTDEQVAKYLTRLIFCMFASDVGLLPKRIIISMIDASRATTTREFADRLKLLFEAMSKGGFFGNDRIEHFDGGLFSDNEALNVDSDNLGELRRAAELHWADIEPSVFGTLFERIINPTKRSQLGSHYTSRADIEEIVEPVLMRPLRNEWGQLQNQLTTLLDRNGGNEQARNTARSQAMRQLGKFLGRLGTTKVLDPACGSGNFLYVSLAKLKELEQQVISFGAKWELFGLKPKVHPRQMSGIELDPYAHELASIVVWIGYLQWKYKNGVPFTDETPILQPLETIKQMDAILDLSDPEQPNEPEWPTADVIIGNPPFLGDKKMRGELGNEYVEPLRGLYAGRLPGQSDLVCYWFEKARALVEAGKVKRVGLLATQAIRGGTNRRVLERIKDGGNIFWAESDRDWVLDGATVHVSMVGFDDGTETSKVLDRKPVCSINADLTTGVDVTQARPLKENLGISFVGVQRTGPFELTQEQANQMLKAVGNPHGRPNTDVVRPWINALDVTQRPRYRWIIDFGTDMSAEEAAKYEVPFEYVKMHVKPSRDNVRRQNHKKYWWLFGEPRPGMRKAIAGHHRYMVTPMVSKHRVFVWVAPEVVPENLLIAIARDDDYTFGILHSHPHELWARRAGTQLRDAESASRYTLSMTFETFPFPDPTPSQKQAIADAANELNNLREVWLNPADATDGDLDKRTLTNLYNQNPTWLINANKQLDDAVMDAYGWPHDISDDDVLVNLLALNFQREPA
jgi:hypothetical protein